MHRDIQQLFFAAQSLIEFAKQIAGSHQVPWELRKAAQGALNDWDDLRGQIGAERVTFDEHLVCPSYPNCDEAPLGCRKVMGGDVEEFGYK